MENIIKEAEEITGVNYDNEICEEMVRDLLKQYYKLQEKYENYQEEVKENYIQRVGGKEYGE